MLLPLDELGVASAKEVSDTVYSLASGVGKQRAQRDGSPRAPNVWRVMILSTGELAVADKIREAGGRARAGQEVRILDIEADAGKGFGVFDHAGTEADVEKLIGAIKAAAKITPEPLRLSCRTNATSCDGTCEPGSHKTGQCKPFRCGTPAMRMPFRSVVWKRFSPVMGVPIIGTGKPGAGPSTIRFFGHASRPGTARKPSQRETVQDWGVTYAELEPYHSFWEKLFGIAGKAGNLRGQIQQGGNPFEAPRQDEYPQPALPATEAVRDRAPLAVVRLMTRSNCSTGMSPGSPRAYGYSVAPRSAGPVFFRKAFRG